jgi:Domain of unknown function (DUF4259)
MGAWGHSAFENDDALDWVAELEEVENTSILIAAFDAVLEAQEDYIEIPEASITISAAEVVAALLGRAAMSLPEEVQAWVAGQDKVDSKIVEKARRAVNRILEDSELKEVWEDSGSSNWKMSVEELLRRLM